MATCYCGGSLTEGFIPDVAEHATWVSVWVKGKPKQKGMWEALNSTGAGVATPKSETLAIQAHRCDQCGLLHLFAHNPVQPSLNPAVR